MTLPVTRWEVPTLFHPSFPLSIYLLVSLPYAISCFWSRYHERNQERMLLVNSINLSTSLPCDHPKLCIAQLVCVCCGNYLCGFRCVIGANNYEPPPLDCWFSTPTYSSVLCVCASASEKISLIISQSLDLLAPWESTVMDLPVPSSASRSRRSNSVPAESLSAFDRSRLIQYHKNFVRQVGSKCVRHSMCVMRCDHVCDCAWYRTWECVISLF